MARKNQLKRSRAAVMERAEGRCEIRATEACTGIGTHVHHLLMRSHGGGHRLENLRACCVYCHDFIHSHPAISYERGWLIRSNHKIAKGSDD